MAALWAAVHGLLTIVATLKAVGIILSISLLIALWCHCGTPDTTLSYCAPAGDWHIDIGLNDWCLAVLFIDSAPAPTIVVLFAVMFIMTFTVTSINARTKENAEPRICYHPISRTLGQQHPLIGDALERIMHRLMILISFVARELLRTG